MAVLLAQKAHSSRKALDLEGHRCREVANILEKKGNECIIMSRAIRKLIF